MRRSRKINKRVKWAKAPKARGMKTERADPRNRGRGHAKIKCTRSTQLTLSLLLSSSCLSSQCLRGISSSAISKVAVSYPLQKT